MEVETEQVGEPGVVTHDELHLGGGGPLVCKILFKLVVHCCVI